MTGESGFVLAPEAPPCPLPLLAAAPVPAVGLKIDFPPASDALQAMREAHNSAPPSCRLSAVAIASLLSTTKPLVLRAVASLPRLASSGCLWPGDGARVRYCSVIRHARHSGAKSLAHPHAAGNPMCSTSMTRLTVMPDCCSCERQASQLRCAQRACSEPILKRDRERPAPLPDTRCRVSLSAPRGSSEIVASRM